jgi:hypothetical protein
MTWTEKNVTGKMLRGEEKYTQNINRHIWEEILEDLWLK